MDRGSVQPPSCNDRAWCRGTPRVVCALCHRTARQIRLRRKIVSTAKKSHATDVASGFAWHDAAAVLCRHATAASGTRVRARRPRCACGCAAVGTVCPTRGRRRAWPHSLAARRGMSNSWRPLSGRIPKPSPTTSKPRPTGSSGWPAAQARYARNVHVARQRVRPAQQTIDAFESAFVPAKLVPSKTTSARCWPRAGIPPGSQTGGASPTDRNRGSFGSRLNCPAARRCPGSEVSSTSVSFSCRRGTFAYLHA
jgi:hypothetical protein